MPASLSTHHFELLLPSATELALGIVTETDAANALGTTQKTRALGVVSEPDAPIALGRVKSRALGIVSETDAALSTAAVKLYPKLATLQDDFATSIDNTTKWPFHAFDTWEAGRAKLPVYRGAGSGSYISQNATTGPFFDLTSSGAFAQIVTPPPIGNASRICTLAISRKGGFSVAATFVWKEGTLRANQVGTAPTDSSALVTYDPIAHAWWRIREAGGTLYWETSPDGSTWTNFFSAPLRFDATAVTMFVNPSSAETTLGADAPYVYVDNINVIGARVLALGIVSENDAAVALAQRKSRLLSVVNESDASFALARSKTRALSLASEVDSALAASRRKTRTLGLASEVDSAFTTSRRKLRSLGFAIESDAPLALKLTSHFVLGLVSEIDSPLALRRVKSRVLGTVVEGDVAYVLSRRRARVLAVPAESGSNASLGRIRVNALGRVLEASEALTIARAKSHDLGLVVEQDVVFKLLWEYVAIVVPRGRSVHDGARAATRRETYRSALRSSQPTGLSKQRVTSVTRRERYGNDA